MDFGFLKPASDCIILTDLLYLIRCENEIEVVLMDNIALVLIVLAMLLIFVGVIFLIILIALAIAKKKLRVAGIVTGTSFILKP